MLENHFLFRLYSLSSGQTNVYPPQFTCFFLLFLQILSPKIISHILSKTLLKLKCQLRSTTHSVILARLDFASLHRNPDGTTVGVPHLHVYREGYGDRFAYEVPSGMLKNPYDPLQVLLDFLATYTIERNGIVDLPDAANRPLFV